MPNFNNSQFPVNGYTSALTAGYGRNARRRLPRGGLLDELYQPLLNGENPDVGNILNIGETDDERALLQGARQGFNLVANSVSNSVASNQTLSRMFSAISSRFTMPTGAQTLSAGIGANNPLTELGLQYMFGDFAQRNPFLGLLVKNVIRGGIGAIVSGNPVAGVMAGTVGALRDLPGVIMGAGKGNKSNEETAKSKADDNEKTGLSFVIDRLTGEGEDVDGARERLEKQNTRARQMENPLNSYRDLVMQRVINFTLPGQKYIQPNIYSNKARVRDLLKNRNSGSVPSLLYSLV